MATIIAPTRNPYAPQVPARRPETVGGRVAPSLPPRRPDTPAPAPRASTMAPIAYAQSQYVEPGDPWSAAAQGWVNASATREGEDAEAAKRAQAADALSSYPDLQKYVANGVMDVADAMRISASRDEKAAGDQAATERKAQIRQRLVEMGFEDLAADFESGLADEDSIYASVVKRSSPSTEDVPNGYRKTESGDLEAIPGGPADPDIPLNIKKPAGGGMTEGQAKTAGYAERMVNAEAELGNVLTKHKDFDPAAASLNPFDANFWEALNRKYGPNIMQSPEYQTYRTASQEWIRAKLRKESGAVIGEQEMADEFATYFPQPGDTQERIELKTRLRAQALETLKAESRGAHETMFEGDEAPAEDAEVARPTTDEEYDALEPGALFVDPDDGQTYRKP